MRFTWAVDGYGKQWICSPDFMNCQYVLFCPLSNSDLWDCIDLLEKQYGVKS